MLNPLNPQNPENLTSAAWAHRYDGRVARVEFYDFSILDRSNGAGWDLACKLMRRRDSRNRGRLSASQALRHRFFKAEF